MGTSYAIGIYLLFLSMNFLLLIIGAASVLPQDLRRDAVKNGSCILIVLPKLIVFQFLDGAFALELLQLLSHGFVGFLQGFDLCVSAFKGGFILLQLRVHLLDIGDILVQERHDLLGALFIVGEFHIPQQLVQPLLLFGEPRHLFEHPHRDVLAPTLAGTFAALQRGILFDNVRPELILPDGQLFLVAHDLFGAEPVVGSQRDKIKTTR